LGDIFSTTKIDSFCNNKEKKKGNSGVSIMFVVKRIDFLFDKLFVKFSCSGTFPFSAHINASSYSYIVDMSSDKVAQH
jgi:hypothetical protein